MRFSITLAISYLLLFSPLIIIGGAAALSLSVWLYAYANLGFVPEMPMRILENRLTPITGSPWLLAPMLAGFALAVVAISTHKHQWGKI